MSADFEAMMQMLRVERQQDEFVVANENHAAVVPPGCTMFLQVIDVAYASSLKRHHLETFMDRKLHEQKLSAVEQRTTLGELIAYSHGKVMETLDVARNFKALGYISTHPDHISIKNFPNFRYQQLPPQAPKQFVSKQPAPPPRRTLFDMGFNRNAVTEV